MCTWSSKLSLICIILLVLSLLSCEMVLGPPLPRTNLLDREAPVWYFRSSPQYNGGAFDQVRLSWNWGEGGNPGELFIRRKSDAPLTGPNDGTLVYRSADDSTEYIDDLGINSLGTTYFYALYYEKDGKLYVLDTAPAIFEDNTATGVTLTDISGFGVSYDGVSTYNFHGPSIRLLGVEKRLALVGVSLETIPSYNIDITGVDFSFDATNPPTGDAHFSRIVTTFAEDQSLDYYYNRLNDASSYDAGDSFTITGITGSTSVNSTTYPELLSMVDYWFDTLLNYGIRIEPLTDPMVPAMDFSNFQMTIYYVGPSP